LIFRTVAWATAAALLAMVAFTATAGLVNHMAVASAAAVAAVGVAATLARGRLDPRKFLADVPRWARRSFVAGAVLLLVQLVPIAAFIIDPNLGTWTARPWRPWQSLHSCVTSYWKAATIVDRTANVYADEIYGLPQDSSLPRRPRRLGPLNVDVYEYPPTFLPIPRLLAAATTDFWQFRRLWFAVNVLAVALIVVVVARRVDTALGTHSVWLTPWIVASPAIVGTLQVGNAHLMFISLAVAAMLLFERQRHAIGGALLAYAIVSKLFPGLLLLYLALRRDWRALGWTAGWGLVILAVSVADFGLAPFIAFADHLPRLISGEAFPAFRNPAAIAINESVPGVVFKVALWGGPPLGFDAARVVGWIYTLFLVAITSWLARRDAPRGYEPLLWIAILSLATLRSPFLPHYGGFPSLWLATLIAAAWWHQRTIRWTVLALWMLLAINTGQGYASPAFTAGWTFLHTVAAFVLVALALRQPAPAFEASRVMMTESRSTS
jgi:alpha-1,2-mannosyltransferase